MLILTRKCGWFVVYNLLDLWNGKWIEFLFAANSPTAMATATQMAMLSLLHSPQIFDVFFVGNPFFNPWLANVAAYGIQFTWSLFRILEWGMTIVSLPLPSVPIVPLGSPYKAEVHCFSNSMSILSDSQMWLPSIQFTWFFKLECE